MAGRSGMHLKCKSSTSRYHPRPNKLHCQRKRLLLISCPCLYCVNTLFSPSYLLLTGPSYSLRLRFNIAIPHSHRVGYVFKDRPWMRNSKAEYRNDDHSNKLVSTRSSNVEPTTIERETPTLLLSQGRAVHYVSMAHYTHHSTHRFDTHTVSKSAGWPGRGSWRRS